MGANGFHSLAHVPLPSSFFKLKLEKFDTQSLNSDAVGFSHTDGCRFGGFGQPVLMYQNKATMMQELTSFYSDQELKVLPPRFLPFSKYLEEIYRLLKINEPKTCQYCKTNIYYVAILHHNFNYNIEKLKPSLHNRF